MDLLRRSLGGRVITLSLDDAEAQLVGCKHFDIGFSPVPNLITAVQPAGDHARHLARTGCGSSGFAAGLPPNK
jgi:hypothetical protein